MDHGATGAGDAGYGHGDQVAGLCGAGLGAEAEDRGALYQVVGIPLPTAALVFLVIFSPKVVVGFITIAAMPGGSLSNIYTHLGRGNVAL